jgi:hypothetical protein
MTSDDELRYAEARRDYVQRVLDDWPPLTAEQRSALAELLRPVRAHADQGGKQ